MAYTKDYLSTLTLDELKDLYKKDKGKDFSFNQPKKVNSPTEKKSGGWSIQFGKEPPKDTKPQEKTGWLDDFLSKGQKKVSDETVKKQQDFSRKALTSATLNLMNLNKNVREENKRYERENPNAAKWADRAGTVASLLVPGGVAKVGGSVIAKAGIKQAAKQGVKSLVKEGAKQGAMYGVGSEVGDMATKDDFSNAGGKVIKGVAMGSGLGALGGAGSKIVSSGVSKALRNSTTRQVLNKLGLNKVANKLRSGIEGQQKREAYQSFERKLGKDAMKTVEGSKSGQTLLDTKNEHLRGLADSLVQKDTKSRQIIADRLDQLRKSQKGEIEGLLDKHLGKHSHEGLVSRQAEQADRAYQKAYQQRNVKVGDYTQGSSQFNKELKNVIAQANKTKKLSGDSVEALDLVKRNLRDTQYSTTAKPHSKIEAGKVADELTKSLTSHSKDYAKAVGHASKEIKLKNAHELGEKFLKSTPEELTKGLKGAQNKYAASQGAKKALKEQVLNKNVESNIAKQVLDDDSIKKLTSIIGEKRAQELANKANAHATKFENFSSLRGGSKTSEHESNKGIFFQGYKAAKRPVAFALKTADKLFGKALNPTLKASTQTKYLMHPEKLKKAMSKFEHGKHGLKAHNFGMMAYHPGE